MENLGTMDSYKGMSAIPVMVMFRNEWKIVVCGVSPETNKQNYTISIHYYKLECTDILWNEIINR